jgi:hypothetical protein
MSWPAAGFVHTHPFLFFAAFGCVFTVYWMVLVRRGLRPTLLQAFLAGLAARLCLLPMPPSDDLARYLWEGRLWLEGFNPYCLAPDHPALAALWEAHGPLHALINHPDVAAIYPPLAQALFAGVAAVHSSWLAFKLAFIALDCLGFWLLARIPSPDTGAGPSDSRAMIAALHFLNPLLILETAGHGRFESLPLLFSIAFLWALSRRRDNLAALLLFLGAMAKMASLALIPVLFLAPLRRGRETAAAVPGPGIQPSRFPGQAAKSALRATLVAAAVAAVTWATGAATNLDRFATEFRYNDAVPFLLRNLPGLPDSAAGPLGLALFFIGGLFLMRRQRDAAPERQGLAFTGLLLAFSPTLHPWYALWALPFAALARSLPWLLLTGTAAAAYLVYARAHATGAWLEIPWLRALEFLPPFLLWAWLRFRRAGGPS